MPLVVPAPFGATDCTNEPVLFVSELPKLTHSGAGLLPVTMYRLPVNFAGARGGIGGLYCGLPSTCSCQFACASAALRGCRFGTMIASSDSPYCSSVAAHTPERCKKHVRPLSQGRACGMSLRLSMRRPKPRL